MKGRLIQIFILFIIFYGPLSGQDTDYGPGYHTVLLSNPAYSGGRGDGTMEFSYLNFYPGHNYNLHSFYFSYDSYFQEIHGGAGLFLSNDYLGGIVNDIRGGLSYSYFLQAGEDLFINAGLSASFFHRGFNFRDAVLPDQIDAMGLVTLPTGENLINESRTVMDIGTGFVISSGNYLGGFSVTHLTQPDLANSGSAVEKLKRKYLLSFAADFELNHKNQLNLRPVAGVEIQGKFISGYGGAVIENRNLAISSVIFESNSRNIDLQAGFSVKKERFTFYYNYRFNIKSANSLLPFTLIHQIGLVFSLNNVEKRLRFKTINIPRL